MSTEIVEPAFIDNTGRTHRSYNSMEERKGNGDGDSDSSWNDDTECYIREILETCKKSADAHEVAGYSAKKLHARYAFPGMLIPTISAPIMGTFKDSEWTPYFGMSAMVMVAICNGFSNFFNFGKKSQQHFNFSGRYG